MDKHSALQFMDQLVKVMDWLEKHSGSYKATPAIDAPKKAKRTQASEAALTICDSYMQQERRVPRNICNDAAVEAKKALTATLRGGLEPLRKSMLFCLNEGDEKYVRDFCSSLEETAKSYFPFELACLYTQSDNVRNLTIFISRTGSEVQFEVHGIRLEANRASAEIGKHITGDCILTQASDDDFRLFVESSAETRP